MPAAYRPSIIPAGISSGIDLSNAYDELTYGGRTIVPEECVGNVDQGPHDTNLLDIRRRYADVLPVQEVMAFIGALE